MKGLALSVLTGLTLAGCGWHHTSPPISQQPRYPSTVHFPHVMATERIALHDGAQFVSPTRLAIVTMGSSSCPSVPDELTYLGRHALRIHLTVGSWVNGQPVIRPSGNYACTLDFGPATMTVAIDSKLIGVHSPLRVSLLYHDSTKPLVRIAAPLRG